MNAIRAFYRKDTFTQVGWSKLAASAATDERAMPNQTSLAGQASKHLVSITACAASASYSSLTFYFEQPGLGERFRNAKQEFGNG